MLSCAMLSFGAQAHATPADTLLRIDGDVAKPVASRAPRSRRCRRIPFARRDDDAAAHLYRGVPISTLLGMAGGPSGFALRGPALATTIIASARDGYRVAFSVAELDTGFVCRRVIVALTVDGQAMNDESGPLRIIVEGEGRPAQWIGQLSRLHVVKAPPDSLQH